MDYLNIPVPANTKLYCVGDIHEHKEQFNKLIEKVKPNENRWIVSVGDVYDKGFGTKAAEEISETLKYYQEQGCGWVVQGNHEKKHLKSKYKEDNVLSWWKKQPIALSFVFQNGYRITALHAGVEPSMTWEDLKYNSGICYIRDLDENGKFIQLHWIIEDGVRKLVPRKKNGVNWHETYSGKPFSYICAGHQTQKDGIAKFYTNSCNLDSCVYETGKLSCGVFGENGKEGLIVVEGKAFSPTY